MGKKLLDNKLTYLVLAVIAAIGLWFYVNVVIDEPSTQTFRNIPITFVGTDALRESGLMLTGDVPTVDLEIEAGVSTMAQLFERSFTLRVDVSRITGATEYSMSYDIVPPSGVSESNFTVLSHTPANVTFTVARYDTVEVPVRGTLAEGSSIAEGYVGRGFQFSQETISISGRADLVSQVKSALVVLSGEELSETLRETRTYQLIGVDNQVLEGLEVTCFPETVEAVYEIWKEVEVPLEVVWEPGGGATFENNVTFFHIDPETVTVLGRPEDVESLKVLKVATINLAEIEVGTQILTREIPLADGLEISGGINTATITMTVDGLEKQVFEVPRESFTLIGQPEGYQADVRTQTLAVTIRGTPEAMEQIIPENIRVTVDVSGVELASGQYAVPVKVQVDSVEGAGVFGSDYQVTVRLTKQ